LKHYQDQNDLKNKALSNYLKEDIFSLARKDEEAYIKAVEEREKKEQQKNEQEVRKAQMEKLNNQQALDA